LVVDVGVGCHMLLPLGAGWSGNPAAKYGISSVTSSDSFVGSEPEMVVVLPGALDYCLRHPVLSQSGLARSWFSLSWHNRSRSLSDSVSLSGCRSVAMVGAVREINPQVTSARLHQTL
jgi:hypothetical protein